MLVVAAIYLRPIGLILQLAMQLAEIAGFVQVYCLGDGGLGSEGGHGLTLLAHLQVSRPRSDP